ncbi:hypothetical protein CEXT_800631 [Caerostris extrusa]|uniref:Uncharacterized protein n=1 Tax=Caerostris extrusa TaxID=172846 RepID=A0AAV4XYP8_CAEEX|nr:hypothetical protein CEXT_800631 [Caerostris extrusa]
MSHSKNQNFLSALKQKPSSARYRNPFESRGGLLNHMINDSSNQTKGLFTRLQCYFPQLGTHVELWNSCLNSLVSARQPLVSGDSDYLKGGNSTWRIYRHSR